MTINTQALEQQIEELVRAHVAACQAAAAGAVVRAFAEVEKRPPQRAPARASAGEGTARRRGPEELASLGARFYEVLTAMPGETMARLAAKVGATPRDLQRPVARLKREGKVRSVGQRHHTRYFPLAADDSAVAPG